MKTFLTLFFILPKLVNLTNFFIPNDGVNQQQSSTYSFALNEQVSNDLIKLSSKELASWDETSNDESLSMSLVKTHKPLLVELDQQLYHQLHYFGQENITYKVDYAFLINWHVNTWTSLSWDNDFVVSTKMNVEYDRYHNLIGNKIPAVSTTNHNIPSALSQKVFLLNVHLGFAHNNEHAFLEVYGDPAWSLTTSKSSLLTSHDSTLQWQISLVISQLTVTVDKQFYDFSQAQIVSKSYWYEDDLTNSVDRFAEQYKLFLTNQYFVWLRKTYEEVNFDFSKFWTNYHLNGFNPNLVINEFHFELNILDEQYRQQTIKLRLLLIRQEHFSIDFNDDYEINVGEEQQLVNELQQKIINSGYLVEYFNFLVEPKTITITSKLPDIISFDPVIVHYHFKQGEVIEKEEPELVGNNDQQVPKFDVKQVDYPSNYFFLLLIPLAFLIVFLSFVFFKKPKFKKRKMIK